MPPLKDVPAEERPREKMQRLGPEALTNTELLAIVLGKGMKGLDVLSLAARVVENLEETGEASLQNLQGLSGVGFSKACQIVASVEFSRRFLWTRPRVRIRTPADAVPLFGKLKSASQEEFMVLTLDGSNQAIKTHTVTIGLVNQSQIHPREAFHPAIRDKAVSVMVAHNHPSGNLEASEADLLTTRRLVEVSRVLGIPLLDHLIVGFSGFSSLRERHPAYFH